jgi:hypothetical protein
MRPESIVLLHSSFDDHLGLLKSIENLPAERLISQFSIEGFFVSILPGLPGSMNRVLTPIRRKIICPDVVAMRGPYTDTRAVIEPQLIPFRLFLRNL